MWEATITEYTEFSVSVKAKPGLCSFEKWCRFMREPDLQRNNPDPCRVYSAPEPETSLQSHGSLCPVH